MPFTPQAGDKGVQLIKAALAAYLALDTELSSYLGENEDGTPVIIDEGFFDETTPVPCIMTTYVGDGQTAAGNQLLRLLVYVIDKERGYYNIDRSIDRLREVINNSEPALEALTFPSTVPQMVLHIEARGTTASTTLPRYHAECKGLYTFIQVTGFPVAD